MAVSQLSKDLAQFAKAYSVEMIEAAVVSVMTLSGLPKDMRAWSMVKPTSTLPARMPCWTSGGYESNKRWLRWMRACGPPQAANAAASSAVTIVLMI